MVSKIGKIWDIEIIQAGNAFAYLAGAAINADGSPHAYHPEKGKGLDYLGNAGSPGNWWGIVVDSDGNPYIQDENDPAPGYYISQTSIANPKLKPEDPNRYANSEEIPFIVLPTGKTFGAKLGDFAMVLNTATGRYCGAVFADSGPPDKIGEVSIFLGKELGLNADPKKGGTDKKTIIYVVFPGTSQGWPLTAPQIKGIASKLFSDWGGFGTLAQLYPEQITAPNGGKMTGPEPIQLKVSYETFIKSKPEQSSKLSADEKKLVPVGTVYNVSKILPEVKGHYAVELANSPDKVFYFFNRHVIFLAPEPEEEEPEQAACRIVAPVKAINPSDRKEIQEALIRVGLLDPPASGRWGSQSESAKRAWLRVCGDKTDFDSESLERLAKHPSIYDLKYKPADKSDPENVLVAKAVQRMADLDFHISISMGSDALAYNLFYLAGTNPDGTLNNDALDQWNDLRCLVSIDSQGTVKKHGVWYATVDAGNYWRGNRRMNKAGALQVDKNKQFLNLSCVGRHGAKQYPALVQVGNLTATRDRTGDGRTKDDTTDSGSHFGSNDHHGWDSPTVGINSAGCCVGKTISGHQTFMRIIKTDRRYRANNGYAWHRTILDGNQFL